MLQTSNAAPALGHSHTISQNCISPKPSFEIGTEILLFTKVPFTLPSALKVAGSMKCPARVALPTLCTKGGSFLRFDRAKGTESRVRTEATS